MPKLIYRVVSVCGTLGYGFPKESFEAALNGRVDAIVSDGGSADAGPFYLGTGTDFFGRDAVKADFRLMAAAGKKLGCPVIVGTSGMGGGDRNLDWMVEVAKEVFAELDIQNARVALIRAELEPETIIQEFRRGSLRATGHGPELSEATLRESTIVGQMGIHPIITALESGATYILAGRSCDSALFAADAIRRGIDPAIAYHVGHIVECGALACDPGSPSDCLVAEIYDDGSALFVAPNPVRRCTAHSIAAHSLYEESHPQLQFYPEGILATEKTEFFSRNSHVAGIRNSRFVRPAGSRWSIKLEGVRRLGARKVSLIFIDPDDLAKIPDDVLVYGRNGVEAKPIEGSQRELGIIVETAAKTKGRAVRLATLLTRYLGHCAYPGRKAASGSLAFPLSPNVVSFIREDGQYGAIIASGTRNPAFCENYRMIKTMVVKQVEAEYPDLVGAASYTITEADAASPALLLRTIDRDPQRLAALHAQEIRRITAVARPKPSSRLDLDAPDAYGWSLWHLFENAEAITRDLFPITRYRANGGEWVAEGNFRPRYFEIGEAHYSRNIDPQTLSLINDFPPEGEPIGSQRLADMAVIIRSKNAGVNRRTFDIVFSSAENYEAALYSNIFSKENIGPFLGLPSERVAGTFFVDSCNAIKISIERAAISASEDERDVFGTQQHAILERIEIPIYAHALSRASAF